MAYFNYRAIDEESRIIKGKIEASDEYELDETLNFKGLKLIEATKSRFTLKSRPGLKEKDLLSFTYFFNLIFTSGIPIMNGLDNMAPHCLIKNLYEIYSLPHLKIYTKESGTISVKTAGGRKDLGCQ